MFYEGENFSANEKHKLEIESMKLKTEILDIELKEKKWDLQLLHIQLLTEIFCLFKIY